MIDELRFTLVADGTSDRALVPVLEWLLHTTLPGCAIQSEWADFRRLPQPPSGLAERIAMAVDLFPCDLLFVHRDAETATRRKRVAEIQEARAGIEVPAVCVVPVRMTEAWLLFDEAAIRRASGNPNGTIPLKLPPLKTIEQLADPKDALHGLLRQACELTGRRLKDFSVTSAAVRVASIIENFTLLRRLSAFRELEEELQQLCREQHWIEW